MSQSQITAMPEGVQYTPSRQVLKFNSINDLMAIAKQLYMAGIAPRNVDRWEKLIPILLTGAELGLGIMQSVKFVTPPVNGICSLWGDAGIGLARASGQLEIFEDRVEGTGDNRVGVCEIKRKGYAKKRFEYSIALAKRLASYRKAHELNPKTKEAFGGPWYDDPDNMLIWRARWRALRTEFADILCGLGGIEEQDEAITVEATSTATHTATAASSPLQIASAPEQQSQAVDATVMVTEGQLEQLVDLRQAMFDGMSTLTEDQRKAEWTAAIKQHSGGVEKAAMLTFEQANVVIEGLKKRLLPF